VAPGVTEGGWLVVDRMIVGEDGFAHTSSPNFPGAGTNKPEGIQAKPTVEGIYVMGAMDLGAVAHAIGTIDQKLRGRTELADSRGTKYCSVPGLLGDFTLPIPAGPMFQIRFLTYSDDGYVTSSESTDIQLRAGEIQDFGLVIAPRPLLTKGITRPHVTAAHVDFGVDPKNGPHPMIVVKGEDFLLENPDPDAPLVDGHTLGNDVKDLYVTFQVGAEDAVDEQGKPIRIGGWDARVEGKNLQLSDDKTELLIPVPPTVALGTAEIRIVRPMHRDVGGKYVIAYYASEELYLGYSKENPNPDVTIEHAPHYAFAPLPSSAIVSVIDTNQSYDFTVSDHGQDKTIGTKRMCNEVARITLAEGRESAPRAAALSADNTRAYVSLEGGNSVAVIDAVALHEIDTDPYDKEGRINPIVLETAKYGDAGGLSAAATPFWIVTDRAGKYAYVSDELSGTIYVLDVDPSSKTYNMCLGKVSVPERDAPLGLRGIAINSNETRLFAAAPSYTIFGQYKAKNGNILIFDISSMVDRSNPKKPVFLGPKYIDKVEVGPEPYGVTATDDPNMILFTDRRDDSQGLGILQRRRDATGKDRYVVTTVDLHPFGLPANSNLPHVFGLSNAQGVSYIPANAMAEVLIDQKGNKFGPHPAFAVISAYDQFLGDNAGLGDPRHNPNFEPFIVTHPGVRVPEVGKDGVTREAPIPVTAGGNVGIIRLKLSEGGSGLYFGDVVAATRPTPNSFPDNVVYSPMDGLLLAAYQGSHAVMAFDAFQIIDIIQNGYASPDKDPRQWIRIPPVPEDLSTIKSNDVPALLTMPVDDIVHSIDVQADFRFIGKNDDFVWTTPPEDPVYQQSPNRYAPIATGDHPRGVAVQNNIASFQPPDQSPYNQRVNLGETGKVDWSNEVPIGIQSTAEQHSGAFQERHDLVGYTSLGESHQLALHYDSLRADPQPIIHFFYRNIPAADPSSPRYLVARLSAQLAGFEVDVPGLTLTDQYAQMGLLGGENFFEIPAAGGDYGAALQVDLRAGDTGVYSYTLDVGIVRNIGSSFVGDTIESTGTLPVVNSIESPFGAGWGLEGYYEIYTQGTGGILIVDGNGHESVHQYPKVVGDFFSPQAGDYSTLYQNSRTGDIYMGSLDGTVRVFNKKGKLTDVVLAERSAENGVERSGANTSSVLAA